MSKLQKLINERKEELAQLEAERGTRFPIIEQARDIRIAYITAELEDLEMLLEHQVESPKDKFEFTNDEYLLMWILVSEGIDAIKFKGGYGEYWFTERQANSLLSKLAKIDNEIRGKKND
ncbi:hypothetical protein [Carnobacterium sp. FSL E2-0243]|uniref:hypothetical protein n=1 Tax=Carnobacterium sp. FSL E2-0243 TaxID=2921365 RepID=UPI0030F933DA